MYLCLFECVREKGTWRFNLPPGFPFCMKTEKKKYLTFCGECGKVNKSPVPGGRENGPVVQLVRTLACHARGRRFEPVPGRHFFAAIAQQVERVLGKDEVASSNLASSSKKKDMTCWSCLSFWVSRAVGPLHPSGFPCSGRQNRPCAKGFPCGENACAAHSRCGPEGPFGGSSATVPSIQNIDYNRPFQKTPKIFRFWVLFVKSDFPA